MGRTDELEKVEKTIKETEARLKTLKTNLDAIDLEIKKIATFERTLVFNVKMLKTRQVVAIAKEFKNSKEELKKVKARLLVLRNDKEHFSNVFKDVHDFLKSTRTQHSKIVQDGENNVIKFRREDGKE